MGISCGATLIKYLLFFFNLLWLALGGVILWLGFRISSFSGSVNDIIDTNMKAGAIVVLVAGFIIFLVAFLGCCGAIKENSCMLSTYGAIILILVVIQCVGAYLAFKYRTDIDGKVKEQVTKEFKRFKGESVVRKAVQEFQQTFECCGSEKPSDWLTDYGNYPASCCGESFSDNDFKNCSNPPNLKYTKGCVDAVHDKLNSSLGGLGGVAIGLVLVQLLIIVSACCLAKEVR